MKNEMIEKADQVIASTYSRIPLVITKGKGCTLWDSEGRAYTDFFAGIAVCNLGHSHPRIAQIICAQAQTLLHVSNLYYTIPQIELASFLVDHSFADKVFFCNSGAEANEAAIKLARKYYYDKGVTGRYRIISMEKSFHGRTLGTLSATGQDKIKIGFAPVLEGFDFVPYNDIEALRSKVDASVCAVMMEPVQGEGGVRCPDHEYVKAVRQLCDETDTLLVFDEIQTGVGRTGKLFAYEHYGVEPDIMTLAKALANGLPMGAMLATDRVARTFGPGAHASTFGGTPIVASAAREVFRILEEEHILDHCRETGAYFKQRLQWLKERHESVVAVRGLGLLLGMELNMEGAPVVNACREKGLLVNCVQGNVLRFAPPLIIKKEDIDVLIAALDELL
ncbi:MAG: acetylornithine transaminase [Desulfobacterales bacterium]|nr:acetylornithine transaminase [Desulfobacterales bacterium]MDD4071829.1 acetylornithine transaminase [Desulfobacterales bacterium]MDD4392536.1 acetylornithine transaminase [Desulfobacterales bacterium]